MLGGRRGRRRRAPEWQRTWSASTCLERDEQGRPLVCDTVTDAKITKVRCRDPLIGYAPPRRLTFTRLGSDDVDEMEGSWELEELGERGTRATYRLAVDPGPVGLLARPLERALRPLVSGRPGAGELSARG